MSEVTLYRLVARNPTDEKLLVVGALCQSRLAILTGWEPHSNPICPYDIGYCSLHYPK